MNSRGKKPEPVVPMKNKPFKCEHCEAAFVREDSLKSHVRQHLQLEIAQKEITHSLDATTFSVLQLTPGSSIGKLNWCCMVPNPLETDYYCNNIQTVICS